MKIIYHPGKSLHEVWNEFGHCYPYLKLHMKKAVKPLPMTDEADHRICRFEISIQPSHSVEDVENIFRQFLGLQVEVLRNQKGSWIPTSNSFFLSLETQNEMGRLSSS